jgi:hypothetical protein
MRGWVGTYCEGGAVGTAIKSLCLDALTKLSPFYGTTLNAREDACLKGVVVLSQLRPDQIEVVVHEIKRTSESKYLSAFREICAYRMINEWYPSLTETFANALYHAWSKEQFAGAARWISRAFEHRNGWPDLTLIQGQEVMFVEVKTSDKLHYSQLVTIPAILATRLGEVLIVRLKDGRLQERGQDHFRRDARFV